MKSYLIKRLISVLPVLFFVSTIVFLILHLTPGDRAVVILGEDAGQEQVEDLRRQLGLDRPIYERYFLWFVHAVMRWDYAVVQGAVLYVTFAFVFINLAVGMLYGVVNPQVRLGQKK